MPAMKIFTSFEEAVSDIPDGATILFGSFGSAADAPQNLIMALAKQGAKNLTIICNTPGTGGERARKLWKLPYYADANLLVENKQVKKLISSITFPGTPAERAILNNEVEIEFVPQGTLAERIRAGGFGIGGFYVTTGIDTLIAEGKEVKIINGVRYLLELPLRADFAFIKAYKADKFGNLIYRGTARTFNPVVAPAADITIAEVDEIVEVGEISPEIVITPEIFVQRIVCTPEKTL